MTVPWMKGSIVGILYILCISVYLQHLGTLVVSSFWMNGVVFMMRNIAKYDDKKATPLKINGWNLIKPPN